MENQAWQGWAAMNQNRMQAAVDRINHLISDSGSTFTVVYGSSETAIALLLHPDLEGPMYPLGQVYRDVSEVLRLVNGYLQGMEMGQAILRNQLERI